MKQEFTINSENDLKEVFDAKREEIVAHCKSIAEEIAENEFDLFEFNLFLTSFGKSKLDESTKRVNELREKVGKGEVDLSKYEDLLDEY